MSGLKKVDQLESWLFHMGFQVDQDWASHPSRILGLTLPAEGLIWLQVVARAGAAVFAPGYAACDEDDGRQSLTRKDGSEWRPHEGKAGNGICDWFQRILRLGSPPEAHGRVS